MRTIFFRFAAFLLLFPLVLFSADPPEIFIQAIQRSLDADATWRMKKVMRSPALTLASSGEVSCFAGRGIVWQAMEPFMSQIRMTTNAMVFVSELDTKVKPLKELPHYEQIREQTDRFLAGDVSAFSKAFEWKWETLEKGWRMTLVPSHSDMRRLVTRAVLEGNQTFDRVTLCYPTGDQVKIEFQETGRARHSLWK